MLLPSLDGAINMLVSTQSLWVQDPPNLCRKKDANHRLIYNTFLIYLKSSAKGRVVADKWGKKNNSARADDGA